MQKVDVTFEGADESPVTQTHYFNLTETDFAEIVAKDPNFFSPSRLKELWERSKAAPNQEAKFAVQAEIAVWIKNVIIHAHGTRVGVEFFHLPEKTLEFTRGLACHAVVQKVLESEETMTAFFMKVLPESVRASFAENAKQQ